MILDLEETLADHAVDYRMPDDDWLFWCTGGECEWEGTFDCEADGLAAHHHHVARTLLARLPSPTPPPALELIDLDTIPDEPCNWHEDNIVDGDHHSSYVCDRCHDISECIFCEPDQPNVECARNRAEDENRQRRRVHERAVQDYEAQMRYYREITS
ncbi:hypothetical protein SEA_CLOWN_90 [Gordonia phage Clown]|uniref:Uncharacterized protein n=1 Tax=Gordonia phage Clown TaxID=2759393 RepID=A0A7L7SLN8_9CAUD|nr:hypothetical protein KNV25_gp90 [Gordonia phage Clown]QOC56088.1 hypothetical protein SEA_CLOWN_90 [Gordonia phage Clown]